MAHKKYGIVPWKVEGRYRLSEIIREYDILSAANKYADKLNEDDAVLAKLPNGYVVRETAYMLSNPERIERIS